MKTYADILISDTHVGHTSGLMAPTEYLDYRASDTQVWLWKVWQTFLNDVDKKLNEYKVDYVHSLWNGDLGDRPYKHSNASEYWVHTESDVVRNTSVLFEPLANMADDIHVVMGNDAHVGVNGTLDSAIAEDFDNVVPFNEKKKLYAHPSVDYELGGLMINAVHKGANKTRWTDVNGLSALSKMVLLDRAQKNERIPDILVRSHFHWAGQIRDIKPHVIATSSFQGKSDFIKYIDIVDQTPQVGGHLLIIRDKKVLYSEPLLYTLERKKAWKPKKK